MAVNAERLRLLHAVCEELPHRHNVVQLGALRPCNHSAHKPCTARISRCAAVETPTWPSVIVRGVGAHVFGEQWPPAKSSTRWPRPERLQLGDLLNQSQPKVFHCRDAGDGRDHMPLGIYARGHVGAATLRGPGAHGRCVALGERDDRTMGAPHDVIYSMRSRAASWTAPAPTSRKASATERAASELCVHTAPANQRNTSHPQRHAGLRACMVAKVPAGRRPHGRKAGQDGLLPGAAKEPAREPGGANQAATPGRHIRLSGGSVSHCLGAPHRRVGGGEASAAAVARGGGPLWSTARPAAPCCSHLPGTGKTSLRARSWRVLRALQWLSGARATSTPVSVLRAWRPVAEGPTAVADDRVLGPAGPPFTPRRTRCATCSLVSPTGMGGQLTRAGQHYHSHLGLRPPTKDFDCNQAPPAADDHRYVDQVRELVSEKDLSQLGEPVLAVALKDRTSFFCPLRRRM